MVDGNFDSRVPSTTRRADGAEVVVDIQENREARTGFEETGVKLVTSGGNGMGGRK